MRCSGVMMRAFFLPFFFRSRLRRALSVVSHSLRNRSTSPRVKYLSQAPHL